MRAHKSIGRPTASNLGPICPSASLKLHLFIEHEIISYVISELVKVCKKWSCPFIFTAVVELVYRVQPTPLIWRTSSMLDRNCP